MKRSAVFLLIHLIIAGATGTSASADDVAATILGYGDGVSTVKGYTEWGETAEDASNRAMAVCKRLAKNCAEGSETTSNLDDPFVIVCCSKPPGQFTCGVGVGDTIDNIRNAKAKEYSQRGFSNCQIKDIISARDGSSLLKN